MLFKQGIVIPVRKGKLGRDPLLTKNYRGIMLTSVFAKVFEIILLQRLQPVLEDRNIPQITQTAYRSGGSCRDSIFAALGAERKFTNEEDTMYSCFFRSCQCFRHS